MEVRIEHITKTVKGMSFIQDVSFVASPKEVVGILATKGSGKSLLLNLIRGSVSTDSGTVSYIDDKGKIFTAMQIWDQIGYLSAENPLYEDMSVIELLTFVAQLYKIPKYIRRDRVKNLIKLCGLKNSCYQKIGELSLGYRQKLGLAQALVNNPSVLLLDEPVKRLDPTQSKEIYDLIKELGKEQTVIVSSRHMSDMENMCDSMLVLSGGSVLTKGSVEALQEQVASSGTLEVGIGGEEDLTVVKSALQHIDEVLHITTKKEGFFSVQVVDNEMFARSLFSLCSEQNWYITRLSSAKQSLEDVFKQLRIDKSA